MYLQEKNCNVNKISEIMISSLQLDQETADIMITLTLNNYSDLKETEHKNNLQTAKV